MVSQFGQLSSQVRELVEHLWRTTIQPEEPEPPAPLAPAVPSVLVVGAGARLAAPECFSGELGQCKAFLIDCSIHFECTPQAFITDRAKIAFIISHLSGRARAWVTAEWARESPLCSSLTDFQAAAATARGAVLLLRGARSPRRSLSIQGTQEGESTHGLETPLAPPHPCSGNLAGGHH